MQVDDRVSLKTFHFRTGALGYYSQVCRFGASDAVSILSMKASIEGLTAGQILEAICLSRNPNHLDFPPGSIDGVADWATDEALYGRIYFIGDQTGTSTGNYARVNMIATCEIDLHGIIVPSRQIACHIDLTSGSLGIVTEVYFKEVKLSRQEADLLNITWGKYRR